MANSATLTGSVHLLATFSLRSKVSQKVLRSYASHPPRPMRWRLCLSHGAPALRSYPVASHSTIEPCLPAGRYAGMRCIPTEYRTTIANFSNAGKKGNFRLFSLTLLSLKSWQKHYQTPRILSKERRAAFWERSRKQLRSKDSEPLSRTCPSSLREYSTDKPLLLS